MGPRAVAVPTCFALASIDRRTRRARAARAPIDAVEPLRDTTGTRPDPRGYDARPMPSPSPKLRRKALEALGREALARLTQRLDVAVEERRSAKAHVDALMHSRTVKFPVLLSESSRRTIPTAASASARRPRRRAISPSRSTWWRPRPSTGGNGRGHQRLGHRVRPAGHRPACEHHHHQVVEARPRGGRPNHRRSSSGGPPSRSRCVGARGAVRSPRRPGQPAPRPRPRPRGHAAPAPCGRRSPARRTTPGPTGPSSGGSSQTWTPGGWSCGGGEAVRVVTAVHRLAPAALAGHVSRPPSVPVPTLRSWSIGPGFPLA